LIVYIIVGAILMLIGVAAVSSFKFSDALNGPAGPSPAMLWGENVFYVQPVDCPHCSNAIDPRAFVYQSQDEPDED
jgi:hypothetical protein